MDPNPTWGRERHDKDVKEIAALENIEFRLCFREEWKGEKKDENA